MRKVYRSNSSYQKIITYHFDEENITIETSISKVELKINSLIKFNKSKNWFFMYSTNQFANLIPKKDLNSEDIKILKYILDKNNVKNTL